MNRQFLPVVKAGVLWLCVGLVSGCGNKEAETGSLLYQQNCKVCHAQGINGAPIVGRSVAWEKRLVQGEDVLVQHAMEGYGLMPAKGGNSELSEPEVRLVVRYMMSQSGKE
ncbi:MAG: cytochrome c5 family protein [Pseudomonadales bacterium]|nr:cytochrome c5 family protein [Pseudomonadales bacterium]